MTGIIRFILSLFIGVVAGLVLMLISESMLILLSCGAVAFLVAALLYGRAPVKKGIKSLLSLAGAAVAFFLYFMLLNALNEGSSSILVVLIFFFGPFAALIYAYTSLKDKFGDEEKGKDD